MDKLERLLEKKVEAKYNDACDKAIKATVSALQFKDCGNISYMSIPKDEFEELFQKGEHSVTYAAVLRWMFKRYWHEYKDKMYSAAKQALLRDISTLASIAVEYANDE